MKERASESAEKKKACDVRRTARAAVEAAELTDDLCPKCRSKWWPSGCGCVVVTPSPGAKR
jgi:hypothetical protein